MAVRPDRCRRFLRRPTPRHLTLEVLSGPVGQQPVLLPGFDGMLRYGSGHEVRIGRAACTPGPDGNNMQLRGSPKVSRRACSTGREKSLQPSVRGRHTHAESAHA